MSVVRLRRATIAVLLPLGAACNGGPTIDTTDDSQLTGAGRREVLLTGDEVADRAILLRLEGRARAFARTEGCTAADCAAQPIGAKACGGPRYYVPYCRRTTDVPALQSAAAAVERFERAFNARYGAVSTCDFAMPPGLTLVAGACMAALR